MAVPTITTVTPSRGSAGGGDLVAVTGTNFRLYTPPVAGDTHRAAAPSRVRVTFDGAEAPHVFVYSATELEVYTPGYVGDPDREVFAPISVVVQNLDDDGDPISGEVATKTLAYTFEREHLRPPTLSEETPVARIGRALLQLLKRQLLLLVSPRTNTDYSADGIELVHAGVPTVSLLGPDIIPDAYGWENESIPELQEDGSFKVWPNPIMHTLIYEITGFSDSQTEFLTLMAGVRKFVWRNPYLVMHGDVPVGAHLRLPMIMTKEPAAGDGVGNANLQVFSATLEVRRVPILYLPPYYRTWAVDSVQLQTQGITGTLVEVKTLW